MKKIKIGDNIHCPATGNMEWPFTAKVLKRYENSYLVAIIAFDPRDRWNVQELVGKTVIAKKACKRLEYDAGAPKQYLSTGY
ncbi:hypothetical protein [Schleiferilactobacillus harbinensis]|uniref:Uncharacterized protein n=1 Tax=Schleiferilactobacillus harbinensis TaxID=304207 RepID=A0A5P8M6P2_9LACO|nr:hypothetical protein [Schleiferilactobacillus harbinensis]QEU46955.1 hypothetical protein FMM01_06395 [Schleiferilactobacillus harbinensis]QFR23997.1 hypothetical protein D1010_11635 [Schleiferilactobacillus harbinensis]